MSEDNLFINAIDVTNIGGIDHFRARLGAINLVVGENGAGKTSLENCFHLVFGGGSDPSLIRLGCDFGQVVFTLSDGTVITKTQKPHGADLIIETKDGGKKEQPATYLRTLASGMRFDPIAFLRAEPKEWSAFLLKNLNLSFSVDEINEACGAPVVTSFAGLPKINELVTGREEQRKTVKQRVKDARASIAKAKQALPSEMDKDWRAERQRIADEVSELDGKIKTAAAEIELEAERARSVKRREMEAAISALQKQFSDGIMEIDVAAADTLALETAELTARQAGLSIELGEANANAEQQQRAAGVRQLIADNEKALEGTLAEEMALDRVIENLRQLKYRKLKETPIQGLDLAADAHGRPVLLIDGVPMEKLNRQQQLFVAIQACSLAPGRLNLTCCEVSELDDQHLMDLVDAATGSGQQMVLARWRNAAPLAVEVLA